MTSSFVAVDLDQVLDEFEEKEDSKPKHQQDLHLGQLIPKTFASGEDDGHAVSFTDGHLPLGDHSVEGTDDLGLQQLEEEEEETLNGQHGPLVNSDDNTTQDTLDVDPYHVGIRKYSEDDSDYSNDSLNISDVIAAAEAITEITDHEEPEDQEQHTDCTSGSEKNPEMHVEESPSSKIANSNENEIGHFAGNYNQSDNEKTEWRSESTHDAVTATQSASSMECTSNSETVIKQSTHDAVTATQSASSMECTSNSDFPIGSDNNAWSSSDGVDITRTASSNQCVLCTDCSNSDSLPLDTAKSECSQSVDRSHSDTCVYGQQGGKLGSSRSRTDEIHPASKFDELDGFDNTGVHECVGYKSNASVSSNVDTTSGQSMSEKSTCGQSTSLDPTSLDPTSLDPTSLNPTSLDPTSLDPTSLDPTSLDPTSLNPTSLDPTSLDPTSLDPTSLDPTSGQSTSLDPTSLDPTSLDPTSLDPTSLNPTSLDPTSLDPTSLDPTSLDPTCSASCMSEAEENGRQNIALHVDEDIEPSPGVSSAEDLYSAGGRTPDNNVIALEQNEDAENRTEQNSYPEYLTASIVHNQSSTNSSNSTDLSASVEGAFSNVISVNAEAVPVSKDTSTQVRHVGFTLPPSVVIYEGPPKARRISSGESGLGLVPPLWVPDSVASHCMNCGLKFGIVKRKHHCRACGKVLCSSCCNMKFSLMYLEGIEGRVCQVCCNALLRAQTISQMTEELNNLQTLSMVEEETERDSEGAMGPSSTDGEEPPNPVDCLEGNDVIQANDEPELDRLSSSPPPPPPLLVVTSPSDDAPSLPTPTSPTISEDSDCLFRLDVDHVRSLMPQEKTILPPVMNVVSGSSPSKDKAVLVTENPDHAEVMYKLKGLGETVVFLVNKSLVIKVKIIKLNCCVKKKCWCFVTEGMGAANQEEMVILLECLHKESTIPGDIFSHFNTAFTYAKEGHTVSNLGYTIFGQPFLGSMDNAGFLYIKPTFQCLENIPVPPMPFVFGILIQRPETTWAQLFPLRLMLRLGAEFRYYPCPLWSVRNRAPVYGQIGQTIMNLLADFKNFQYTLPPVTGLLIHLEEQQTKLLLPQDRYDEIVKVLNSTDDHVMALGATFSQQADSHLVCMQDDSGYKTQAINIQSIPRKVTGASFVVFTGALKASSPYSAKVNIVEDGILVQLTPEAILELRQALREMRDHSIKICIPGQQTDEMVLLEWVSRVDHTHSGVCSEIDELSLEGFPSIRMHAGADFTECSNLRIQCSDVFFMNSGAKTSQFTTDKKLNKMLGSLSKACCTALKPHLVMMSKQNMNKIGLRINMDADSVGYNIGSNLQPIPPDLMADLDNEMVPALNKAATRYRAGPLVMELLFRILKLF